MNLRSVFTAEQQRILQRYYENGMTNQSKNCFQLILQCAQETKLDFSVVRTWVGNKRRKMSSKNVVDSGGTPSGTVASTLNIPTVTNVRSIANLASPQTQQASWTSSNNDVMVTGVYTPARSSHRLVSTKQSSASVSDLHKNSLPRPQTKSEPEFQRQQIAVAQQAPHCKNASLFLGEKTIILSRQTSVLNSANSIYDHAKKSYGGSSVQTAELVLPQKPMLCHRPSKVEQMGCQRLPKPEHPILASHVPSGQRASIRDPSCSTHNVEIREVFSLAVTDQPQRILGGNTQKPPSSSADGSYLSIAMETGDVDDEYAREEELASMGAQIQNNPRLRGTSLMVENPGTGPAGSGRSVGCSSHLVNSRDLHNSTPYHNRDYHLPPRTSLHTMSSTLYSSSYPSRGNLSSHSAASNQRRLSQNQNNYQISGNIPAPWTMGSSRKRALQDRTQFSDRDLATLKRYWDRGMTSLGAICREKIEAVAAELNVDCEIVRTWIGNRRRKYRLMGIEVLPPLGGPALFPNQSDSSSRSITIPEDDASTDVGDDNDRNDEVSICLSEGSSQEEQSEVLQNEDTGHGREDQATLTDTNGTIQIIDDEEDGMISEIEQLNCLLEFKTQEVRFVEEDLEHEKKKYVELQAFTRRLILAVKMDDKEQQQALLADLPPDLEEMDFNHSFPEPDDTSFSLSSSSEKNTSDSL
uniref:Highly divergent homeobox n=3 Tax=Podarcis muralis TaxID=64176 RepID=A0A670K8B9_PODMU|nr:highly divergent homeobox isoform X2 [Podarcis muralis]XP_028571358.1 highly divergent homeobox isoform X2 [Podarcis muralis]XP_028571359.1 highly divergent homeobox isoform X2 [Podarcis muralis]